MLALAAIAYWMWGPISDNSFRQRDQFFEGARQDIGVWLPTDAPTEDLASMFDHVCVPEQPGESGCYHIAQVGAVSADYGSMTLWITMVPGTSDERREEVAALFREDPRVEHVEVDVTVGFDRG